MALEEKREGIVAVKYRNVLLLLGIIFVLVVVTVLSTKRNIMKDFPAGGRLSRILVERSGDTTEILIGD